jgi:parallel beta-helix repeat protein
MKKNLTAFALLIFMFVNVSYAQSWWYVNDNSRSNDLYTTAIGDDGNAGTQAAPFATINHAISAAAIDDIIIVDAGTYIENVVVSKKLDIRGAQPEYSIIEATNANATPLIFAASGASVQKFTITHNYTPAELAAWNFNNNGVQFNQGTSNNILSECVITLNRNGIYLNTCQNNSILTNIITDNRTGINMTGNINGTTISGNVISDNWTIGIVSYAPASPGTNLTDYSTVIVTGNTFEDNWYTEILIKDAALIPEHSMYLTILLGTVQLHIVLPQIQV